MVVNIVIVDDLEDEIEFFSQLFTKAGYQVISTNRELELLEIINGQPAAPDLILINGLTKDIDCYFICKKIKFLERGKNIPIIFINRDKSYFKPERMFESGGVDYINYPSSETEVLVKVKTQLKIKDLEAQLRKKNSQIQNIIPHCKNLETALEQAKAELEKCIISEPITKLPNRSRFEEILHQEWLRCSRERISFSDLSGTNISLILCQINDFTQYQENYGEQLAKNCLKMVAETIKKNAKRPADLVAVYESENFAILLPNTDQEGAKKVAQIVKEKIQELQILHPYSSVSEYITVTMGVATGIPTQALPAKSLVEAAEKALEQALKQGGEAIVTDSF